MIVNDISGLCSQELSSRFHSFRAQVTQSLATSEFMYRPLKCDHSLESHRAVPYCGTDCFSIFPVKIERDK